MDLITYALLKQEIGSASGSAGTNFDFTYDPVTGALTFSLKNKAGEIIASRTVAIKTSAVIKRGYYDDATQEIVLVLADETGTEIRIPVGDIVENLKEKLDNEINRAQVAEAELAGDISELDNKVDAKTAVIESEISTLASSKQDKLSVTGDLKLQNNTLSTNLRSGVDVKTLNTQSLLGEGNITIPVIHVDSTVSAASTNPVQSSAIYTELVGKVTKAELATLSAAVLKIAEVKNNGLEASQVITDKVILGSMSPIEIYRSAAKALTISADTITVRSGQQLATHEDVQEAINKLIDSAPETLDTLAKIAEALKQGEGVLQAIMTAIDTKASKSSLALVATTGDYNDLFNKPQIPSAATPISYFEDDGTYVKTGAPIFDKLASKEYVDQRAKAKFTYKGKVQTYEDLLQVTGMVFGDFWWVVEPKEEGQDGNMSYIWQDDDMWHEFMPMGQGSGSGGGIIHVEELPELDQELDKLYQMTSPKVYTDIYLFVQGILIKNQVRLEDITFKVNVIPTQTLDILDARPFMEETYDRETETGTYTINIYEYEDEFYWWGGRYVQDAEGNEYYVAVGTANPFDEDHPAHIYGHKFLGQEDIDYALEYNEDIDLSLIKAEPWPDHLMFTLKCRDSDGHWQEGHFYTRTNEDPEPNGDDPDERTEKLWGLVCDNEYFKYNYDDRYLIYVTDSTECVDEFANKWNVQYRFYLPYLVDKGAEAITLEVDSENFEWWNGGAYSEELVEYCGQVEGSKDVTIGKPYKQGDYIEESDYDSLFVSFDIPWGTKVFEYKGRYAETFKPMYYYGFGHCVVYNEEGDAQEYDLRTYATTQCNHENTYSLNNYLAISTDRRNNDIFEYDGKTYKVIDWVDSEEGTVRAAIVNTQDEEEEFDDAEFLVKCDDAYLFSTESDLNRAVKVPLTLADTLIGEGELWGTPCNIYFYYGACTPTPRLVWKRKSDGQEYASTNSSYVEDGYAVFITYYLYDYDVTYFSPDIIAGRKVRPTVDNRIVIFKDIRVPEGYWDQPIEMGGGYGKAGYLSPYSAVSSWDEPDLKILVSDKLFYVDLHGTTKLWSQKTVTETNAMYMYDESKFHKLITDKDFEEASSNFITPDNVKDYIKINNFIYWDYDRALPSLDEADGNKFYIKRGVYYHADKQNWRWHSFESTVVIPADTYSSLYDYFQRSGQQQSSDKLYLFTNYKYDDSKLWSAFYFKSSDKYNYAQNAGADKYGNAYRPIQLYFAKWDAYNGRPISEERFVYNSSENLHKLCVVDTEPGQSIGYYDDLNGRFRLYYLDYLSPWGWREITRGSSVPNSGPIFRGFVTDFGSQVADYPADGDLYVVLSNPQDVFSRESYLYYKSDYSSYNVWEQIKIQDIDYTSMGPVGTSDTGSSFEVKKITSLDTVSSNPKETTLYHFEAPANTISSWGSECALTSVTNGRKDPNLRSDTHSAGLARMYEVDKNNEYLRDYEIAYPFGKSTGYSGGGTSGYLMGKYTNQSGGYTYNYISYNMDRRSFTFIQPTYIDKLNLTYLVNQKDSSSYDRQYQDYYNGIYMPMVLTDNWLNLNSDSIKESTEYSPSDDSLFFHLATVTAKDNYGIETTYDLGVYKYLSSWSADNHYRIRAKATTSPSVWFTDAYHDSYIPGCPFKLNLICGPKNPIISIKVTDKEALGALMFFDQKDWNKKTDFILPHYYGYKFEQLKKCPFTTAKGSDNVIKLSQSVQPGEHLFTVGGKNFYFMYVPAPNQGAWYTKMITDTPSVSELYKADGSYNFEHICGYYEYSTGSWTDNTPATGLTQGNMRDMFYSWEEIQEVPTTNYTQISLYSSSNYCSIPDGPCDIWSNNIIAGFFKVPDMYPDSNLINIFKDSYIGSSDVIQAQMVWRTDPVKLLCYYKSRVWNTIDVNTDINSIIKVSDNLSLTGKKLDVNMDNLTDSITPKVINTLDEKVGLKYYRHGITLKFSDYTPDFTAKIEYISKQSEKYSDLGPSIQERYNMFHNLVRKPILVHKNSALHQGYMESCEWTSEGYIFEFEIKFFDGMDPLRMQGNGVYFVDDEVQEIL